MKGMKRYCVIGFPLGHTLSPRLHNGAFRRHKIAARYKAAEVKPAQLAKFMKNFRANFAGANVTIPHKISILKYLDRVSPEARAIGAVNAIVNKNGLLTGYNTDASGALEAVKTKLKSLRGKKCIVVGAGGAARAVVYSLKKAGAHVAVLNRSLEHARIIARDFGCLFDSLAKFEELYGATDGCDLIINTTSVGMWEKGKDAYKKASPLPNLLRAVKAVSKKPLVMDIIYRPRMTKLLRDAKKAGCTIITGDKMFLGQAKKSFELWTGLKKF